jgi:membrane-associated protease RseP (regulator of RpoE activity)
MSEVKRVEFQYGIILLRTKRFQSLMDRLGSQKISKPVGWFLLYILPVVAAIGLFIFLSQLSVFFSPARVNIGTTIRSVTPLAYLGIPGLNPYLPWIDGWIALIVAMVIHEGAHGVVARSLGLPVKSAGLVFFLFILIGAFVEVDEDAMKAARARDSGRVLAAGAGVNFVVGIAALLLLFSVVSTMTPAVSGVGVVEVVNQIGGNDCQPGACPAFQAGIQGGDFLTAINGVRFTDPSMLGTMEDNGSLRPGQVVVVSVWSGGETRNISLTLASNPDNSTRAFLGINEPLLGPTDLRALVSGYTGSFFTRPIIYLCIPTLPQCQSGVPFSGAMAAFYTSPYGASLEPLATLLYWLFFINFNLAVFNALPLGPLDGGQAFKLGVGALGRGRLSDATVSRISIFVALAVLAAIFSVPLSAYLHLI